MKSAYGLWAARRPQKPPLPAGDLACMAWKLSRPLLCFVRPSDGSAWPGQRQSRGGQNWAEDEWSQLIQAGKARAWRVPGQVDVGMVNAMVLVVQARL